MPVFYRGIALDLKSANSDRTTILHSGQIRAKSVWEHAIAFPSDVRTRLGVLVQNPSKIREEISLLPKTAAAYACGDFEGAARYALRAAGTSTIPVVIVFECSFENIIIDGRDCLHNVFQIWDRNGVDHRSFVRESLLKLFGFVMIEWFDRAGEGKDQTTRLGLCDLAVHELVAIKHHYDNVIDIIGRHDRRFRSAFVVPAQLDPKAIQEIRDVPGWPNDATESIDFHKLVT